MYCDCRKFLLNLLENKIKWNKLSNIDEGEKGPNFMGQVLLSAPIKSFISLRPQQLGRYISNKIEGVGT